MGSFSAGADRLLPAMGILHAVQVQRFARALFRDCLLRPPSTHLFFNHKQPLSTTLAAADPSPKSNLALLGAHQSHLTTSRSSGSSRLKQPAMCSSPTAPAASTSRRGLTPRSLWPIAPELARAQHGFQAPPPYRGPGSIGMHS